MRILRTRHRATTSGDPFEGLQVALARQHGEWVAGCERYNFGTNLFHTLLYPVLLLLTIEHPSRNLAKRGCGELDLV